jgi:glutamine synthetase
MKDWIKQNQITEVECIIPDLAGAARGKIMPASKFVGSSDLRMPQSVFKQSVTGDYPDIFEQLNPLDIDVARTMNRSSCRATGMILCNVLPTARNFATFWVIRLSRFTSQSRKPNSIIFSMSSAPGNGSIYC